MNVDQIRNSFSSDTLTAATGILAEADQDARDEARKQLIQYVKSWNAWLRREVEAGNSLITDANRRLELAKKARKNAVKIRDWRRQILNFVNGNASEQIRMTMLGAANNPWKAEFWNELNSLMGVKLKLKHGDWLSELCRLIDAYNENTDSES